jgi:hypothetical protein
VEAYFTYELQEFHAQFWNESVTATEFFWNFGDTASGSQNTSTHINPSHDFSGPGNYIITLEANHPCFEGDVFQDTIAIIEVGLYEPDRHEVKVFPIPADEWIRIETPDEYSRFRILDINGNTWQEGELSSKHIMTTSNFPAGIYLLEIEGERDRFVQKIIIK